MIIEHADIKDPIIVVKQLATEEQYGLCPSLLSGVRNINESPEMSASVVCEEGIAKKLSEILIPSISGKNLIPDTIYTENTASIFLETITSGDINLQNTLKFRSLILSGNIKGELDCENHKLYITTDIENPPGNKEYLISPYNLTTNGGIIQENFLITWEDFYKSNNQVELTLNKSQQSISKIIIEVLEPFSYSTKELIFCDDENCIFSEISTKYSIFSVGFDTNLSAITYPFTCPAKTGEISGIIYGPLMSEKKYILNTSDTLKIYKISDTIDTNGKFKISIFYDNIPYKHLNKNSFLIVSGKNGNEFKQDVEVYDYTTLTHSFIRGKLNSAQCGYSVFESVYNTNKISYIFGGSTGSAGYQYSIFNTCTKIDGNTFTTSDISNTMENVMLASTGNNEFGDSIVIGGYKTYSEFSSYEANQTYIKFNLQTETFSLGNSSTISNLIYQGAGSITNLINSYEIFIFGGRSILTSNSVLKTQYYKEIYKFNMISETYSTIGSILNYSEGQKISQDGKKFYIIGGMEYFNSSESNSGKLLTDIMSFDKSTDTIASLEMKILTSGKSYGGLNSNVECSKGYYIGGGSLNLHEPSQERYIDIIDYSVDVVCIKCRSSLTIPRVGIEAISN